jgi:hypothetical protein
LASTTTTPVVTTAPPATTTEAPSTTTAPTTTTTAVITDASTADRKALAGQLQAVLDRYHQLYVESRSDPERPFTDQQLFDEFRLVADNNAMEALIHAWSSFRDEASAVRLGPAGITRRYLTSVEPVDSTAAAGQYCIYDDGVTFRVADGTVLDDSTVVAHADVTFKNEAGEWRVDRIERTSDTQVAAGSANPCPSEQKS